MIAIYLCIYNNKDKAIKMIYQPHPVMMSLTSLNDLPSYGLAMIARCLTVVKSATGNSLGI